MRTRIITTDTGAGPLLTVGAWGWCVPLGWLGSLGWLASIG